MARPVKTANGGEGEAVVGRGTTVRGRISGDGDLRVEGTIDGDVALDGTLTVADGASVTADVQAASVLVEGALDGDIGATGAVAIRSGARVRGTIRGGSFAIEEGASLSGRIEAEFEMPEELSSARPDERSSGVGKKGR